VVSGANSSLHAKEESAYLTAATVTTGVIGGHGLKITSQERNNNLQAVWGLGSRTQTVIIEKQFTGTMGIEFLMSNPWFLYPILGAKADGGSGPSSYTHTFTEANTLPSFKFQNSLNIDTASTNDLNISMVGAVNTGASIKTSVGEAVSVSDVLPEFDRVWFGTDEFVTTEQPEFNIGGIYSFDRKFYWNRISKADGLDGNGIYALGKTGNYIWAGIYEFDKIEKQEYGKGMYLINRVTGSVKKVDLNKLNISSSSILCFLFDGENMWVGTGDGLIKIRIENQLAQWSPNKNKKLRSGK